MATLIKASYPSSVSHVDLYTSLGTRANPPFLSFNLHVALQS
jgi:hypothetical protein